MKALALALLLLSLAACGAEPPPPPAAAVSVAAPPPPPVDTAPPLPPPSALQAHAPEGCDAPRCTGSVTPDLQAALTLAARATHRCYDEALLKTPTLEGKVSLSTRISESGEVCGVQVKSSDLPDPKVTECMVGRFAHTRAAVPPPSGGCLDVTIPIALVPPRTAP